MLFYSGPSKAKELYEEGIKDLEDLKKHEDKLTHAQKIGLAHFQDFELRIPRAEISEIFCKLEKIVGRLDPEYRVEVCGSFRRGAESSGDIDVLVTHPHYKHGATKHGNLLHRGEIVSSVIDCLTTVMRKQKCLWVQKGNKLDAITTDDLTKHIICKQVFIPCYIVNMEWMDLFVAFLFEGFNGRRGTNWYAGSLKFDSTKVLVGKGGGKGGGRVVW